MRSNLPPRAPLRSKSFESFAASSSTKSEASRVAGFFRWCASSRMSRDERKRARASASLHTSSITAARERRACSNLSSEAFDRTGSLRSSSTTGNSTSASISSSASCR